VPVFKRPHVASLTDAIQRIVLDKLWADLGPIWGSGIAHVLMRLSISAGGVWCAFRRGRAPAIMRTRHKRIAQAHTRLIISARLPCQRQRIAQAHTRLINWGGVERYVRRGNGCGTLTKSPSWKRQAIPSNANCEF